MWEQFCSWSIIVRCPPLRKLFACDLPATSLLQLLQGSTMEPCVLPVRSSSIHIKSTGWANWTSLLNCAYSVFTREPQHFLAVAHCARRLVVMGKLSSREACSLVLIFSLKNPWQISKEPQDFLENNLGGKRLEDRSLGSGLIMNMITGPPNSLLSAHIDSCCLSLSTWGLAGHVGYWTCMLG